ncbi:AsnC family transcriptional regulator [Halorubellus sp. JP-L1]|uniref:AsnC family transcriptional regulator n=1 Tax=Halorubellus sp. JP-L1 TaxID=2715753 RepID=UPI001408D132|nr:AsnC family transcriptional regulator [Halorubellus sp. JP-L1]
MRDLDDIDMEILELLADDARRPFSDIGDVVGRSGPAVSERVSKLEEAGVLRGFTVDVDRSQLRDGVPVLVELSVASQRREPVKDALRATDAVEHLFTTASGDVVVQASLPNADAYRWVEDVLDPSDASVVDVTLLAEVEWTQSVGATDFAVSCAECGNTVTSEGSSATLGEETYRFCCESCEGAFRDRYDRFSDE